MVCEIPFVERIKHEALEHKTELEVAGAAVVAGALLYATRGKIASVGKVAQEVKAFLPELSLIGESAAKVAPKLAASAEEVLTATRPQTAAERFTERGLRMSVSAAKTVLTAIRGAETPVTLTGDAAVLPTDEVRKHVFNRFLARLDGDYVLHGSYALETQVGRGARKAVNDLDILSTNPALATGSASEISAKMLEDLRRSVGQNLDDGMSFKVDPTSTISDRIFPRMRHFVASAEKDGQEVMRIPLDVRVGAKTILEPDRMTLTNTIDGVEHTTSIKSMAKEETLAYKLYTYSNRYVGGIKRKPKDLNDMAALINSGVSEAKTTEALQAWTSRGFGMSPLRPARDILGSEFALPPSEEQKLADSFKTVKGFYEGIGNQVENTQLAPQVSDSWFAQSTRFLKKHYVIYPAELKKASALSAGAASTALITDRAGH